MANRRTQAVKKRAPTEESDDFAFLASQQSSCDPNSDDQALELALAKHYAVAREKKKQEKEKKLLQAAAKQLSHDVSLPAEDVRACVRAVDELFSNFTLEYATSEDRIRKLWLQAHQAQNNFVLLLEKRYGLDVATAAKTEEQHLAGLSKTKASCQDFQNIINKILSEDGS